MKKAIPSIALVVGISVAQLCMAQAAAGAPAGSSGQCNDATYSTAGKQEGSLPRSQGRKRVVWPDGHSLNEKTGRSCFNSHWGSGPSSSRCKALSPFQHQVVEQVKCC